MSKWVWLYLFHSNPVLTVLKYRGFLNLNCSLSTQEVSVKWLRLILSAFVYIGWSMNSCSSYPSPYCFNSLYRAMAAWEVSTSLSSTPKSPFLLNLMLCKALSFWVPSYFFSIKFWFCLLFKNSLICFCLLTFSDFKSEKFSRLVSNILISIDSFTECGLSFNSLELLSKMADSSLRI